MNRASTVGDTFVRAFKVLVRDIACPIVGLYLAIRLGQGVFEVAAIIPMAGLTSALIGIPYWSRIDERRRGNPNRGRKQLTVDGDGIRWGEKAKAKAENDDSGD